LAVPLQKTRVLWIRISKKRGSWLGGAFLAAGDVMYERTSTAEIDFVGATIKVPFESKYVERNWRSESRALAARYSRGIVATRNVLNIDSGDIWALPTSVVVWLLGT
jgi:hypothetical protein